MKNFYTSKSDRSDLRDPHLSDWNQGRSPERWAKKEKAMGDFMKFGSLFLLGTFSVWAIVELLRLMK